VDQGPRVFTLRLLNTILFSTRSLKGKVKANFSSITEPSKAKADLRLIGAYSKLFFRDLGYFHSGRVPSKLFFKRFHFSTKSGPNGHSLFHWLSDLWSIPYGLSSAISRVGGPKMKAIMETFRGNLVTEFLDFFPLKLGCYRKISSFADKEGKTRTIAILDYWSQTVLRNLHLYLFRVLKKIPQDCTFDQGSFKTKIKD